MLGNSILFKSKKVHVYFVIYFLLINDLLGGCVEIFHDIPSYFQEESIFKDRKSFN